MTTNAWPTKIKKRVEPITLSSLFYIYNISMKFNIKNTVSSVYHYIPTCYDPLDKFK